MDDCVRFTGARNREDVIALCSAFTRVNGVEMKEDTFQVTSIISTLMFGTAVQDWQKCIATLHVTPNHMPKVYKSHAAWVANGIKITLFSDGYIVAQGYDWPGIRFVLEDVLRRIVLSKTVTFKETEETLRNAMKAVEDREFMSLLTVFKEVVPDYVHTMTHLFKETFRQHERRDFVLEVVEQVLCQMTPCK